MKQNFINKCWTSPIKCSPTTVLLLRNPCTYSFGTTEQIYTYLQTVFIFSISLRVCVHGCFIIRPTDILSDNVLRSTPVYMETSSHTRNRFSPQFPGFSLFFTRNNHSLLSIQYSMSGIFLNFKCTDSTRRYMFKTNFDQAK